MARNKSKISIFSLFLIVLSLGVFLYALYFRYTHPVKKFNPPLTVQEEPKENLTETVVLGEKTEDSPAPVKKETPPVPKVTALSYIVYDVMQDKIVADKYPDLILPPASTTKLMTALVALDEYSIEDVLPIPKDCLKLPGTQAYLLDGDFLSVESLLYALLLPSGSDAACVLAQGHNNPSDFLAKMNKKAEGMGLTHTRFDNVIGLDSDNGNQLSTASDLLIIAREVWKNPELMKIVGTRYYKAPSHDSSKTYTIRNTNELLFSLPGTVGMKTGTTEKAGECLIYAYANTSKDKKVIIIVMGSSEGSRFTDTKNLLDWYLAL
ncbi:MAG: hypothetical protein ABIJ36_01105 [Patescibacteria group bacterium]|nr:hypothetical protein [Patescibacteria group bacterium]